MGNKKIMKQNVGEIDRYVRFALGVVLVVVGYMQMMWWLVAVGVVAFLTGLFRRCGAYTLLGVSTCKIEPKTEDAKTE